LNYVVQVKFDTELICAYYRRRVYCHNAQTYALSTVYINLLIYIAIYNQSHIRSTNTSLVRPPLYYITLWRRRKISLFYNIIILLVMTDELYRNNAHSHTIIQYTIYSSLYFDNYLSQLSTIYCTLFSYYIIYLICESSYL